jgi:hypothetical protein
MLNGKDVTLSRLNGADTDGDLVFVTDNEIMKSGVNRNIPITLDIDDKITAIEVQYNKQSVIDYILRSLDCRIGEISNVSTCYLNKQTRNPDQIKRYDDYICLLSVINGKEIDEFASLLTVMLIENVGELANARCLFNDRNYRK